MADFLFDIGGPILALLSLFVLLGVCEMLRPTPPRKGTIPPSNHLSLRGQGGK